MNDKAADELTGEEAFARLAKIDPHRWAPETWHLRRIRRYLSQLKSRIGGKNGVDCQALAAKCRRDARLSEANCWKRFYRDIAVCFDRMADSPKDRPATQDRRAEKRKSQ